jgi:hypothetical protein
MARKVDSQARKNEYQPKKNDPPPKKDDSPAQKNDSFPRQDNPQLKIVRVDSNFFVAEVAAKKVIPEYFNPRPESSRGRGGGAGKMLFR